MSLSKRQTRSLERLARDTFRYFWDLANPEHGLVPDSTKQGYPSIGCMPCTTPVAEGEDPRSGRWRNSDKSECGLHLA